MRIILNHEKNYLTKSGYFGSKFLYFGAFFSGWGKFVWEKSGIYVSGANFIFLGGIFQNREILNLCYRGEF